MTAAPLWGMVRVDALGIAAATDPFDGSYTLELPSGDWTLRGTAADYEDRLETVTMTQGGDPVRDFPMIAADDDDDGVANAQDCSPDDSGVWSPPTPARGLAAWPLRRWL